MSIHSSKCPRCGHRLDVDTAVGEQVICSNCQALLCLPGKRKASDKADPLIGERLGQYEVLELLGRGGMGSVYKARQTSLDRLVAIKILPQHIASDSSFVERFSREGRAAAALSHPNIIQVYDVGEDRGYHYIAMEYVDGESLSDLLRREGRLAPDRGLDLLRQAAAALAQAHALGIVHRDIKPSNILLTSKGQVKIADFGLAKRQGVDVSVTASGQALGTPLYMPPETARGEKLGPAADLYSLGATFYQALAGRPPFEGRSAAELIGKHLDAEPPALNELAPDVPPALARVIHRLLKKTPAERYKDACELLDALDRLGSRGAQRPAHGPSSPSGVPHPALSQGERGKPIAARIQARKARQRRLLLIAAGSAAVVVLVLVLIVAFGGGRRAEPPLPPSDPPKSLPASKGQPPRKSDPSSTGAPTMNVRICVRVALWAFLVLVPSAARAAEPLKQTYTPIPKENFDKWAANLYNGARPKAYTGKRLTHVALPLGGIGTGSFAINGEGRLMQWQIFNNFNIGTAINDSFFAVWAKPEGGEAVARLLQTAKLADLPPIETLSFVGEYPFGWFTYRDKKLPVEVTLEAFNPMIPLNPKDSAYPAAVLTFTVKNLTDKPCDVSLLASLQNAVGFAGQGGYQGTSFGGFAKNRNQLRPPKGGTPNEEMTVISLGAEPGEPASFDKPVRLFSNTIGPQETPCKNVTLGRPGPRWGMPRSADLAKNFDVIWIERVDNDFGNRQIEALADAVEKGATLILSGARGSLAYRFATAPRAGEPTPPPPAGKRPPITYENFESGTYDNWTLKGEAFGKTPATGTLAAQQPVGGFRGKYLVNTFLGGDDPHGTATSKPFTIERRYINFLIGGGQANQTCMNLLVDGKVVRTATGKDQELLEPACWDVAPLLGKQAQLQIVDNASGGWGHINVDEILFSDDPNAFPVEAVTPRLADLMPFTCDGLGPDAKAFLLQAPAERLALDPFWKVIPEKGVQLGPHLNFTNLKAKPEARVAYSAPDGTPLLIEGKVGKGRVIVFTADVPRAGGWGPASAFAMNLVAYVAGTAFSPATGIDLTHRGWGTMALATSAPNATALPQWRDAAKLWADFAPDGKLTNDQNATPSESGATWNSALAAPLRVEPGKEAKVTFIVAWHFPNHYYAHAASVRIGNMYSNWFKDAEDAARQLAADLDRLHAETKLYHDAIYDSSLPYYVVDAITSQSDILRSQTCIWLEDGHFLAFEGGGACCPMNCTHVWNYAQTLAKLYPTLERNLRETDLGPAMNKDGMVGHRIAVPPTGPSAGEATDGQCGTVLKAYREYLQSADDAWLKKIWPRVKLATQYLLKRDKETNPKANLDDWTPVANRALLDQILKNPEPDGILIGDQWNTYDCSCVGPNPFIGSLYLGALRAAEEMATLCDDPDFAKTCRTVFERGTKNFDDLMWNPDFGYYVQTFDEKKVKSMQFGWGCHADQNMGQWWADIVGLGYILPKDHVRSAVSKTFEHNWRTNFVGHKQVPRIYALNDDKGLLICTWPHGRRPDPVTLYSDEIWTGIEYEVAAALIYQGMVKEGLTVVLGCRDRYNGVLRPGTCCTVGNPFDETECGNTYARALSSWSVLLALQGYMYEGPKGILGFKPRYQPERHRSFFTTAEGWGVFDQRREARKQAITLDLRYGQLALKELVFELPEGAAAPKATLTVAGKPIEPTLRQSGVEVRLTLPDRAQVAKGERVQVDLTW